ncbi:MAG TPA: hypothetical protein VKA85_12625 [Candidatus Limnocylindrales bacterium]|nr:hypothetical protein [Candidatus Limnocylindrales bacterium]
MDQSRFIEMQYRIEHRHNDGSWSPMEQVQHHDSASHDPERSWGRRQIFRCKRCDETVIVMPGDEGGPPEPR